MGPSRKKANLETSSPTKLTQTTLHDTFGFPQLSPTKSAPSTKSQRPLRPSRARLVSSDREEDTNSDVGAIHFEKETVELSSDDDIPRLSPMKKRRIRVDSFDDAETSVAPIVERAGSGNEDAANSEVCWKNKGKGKQRRIVDSDGDGQSIKRRLVKGVRPPTPEEDDLSDIDENRKDHFTLFIY
jgi:hypothetical protein